MIELNPDRRKRIGQPGPLSISTEQVKTLNFLHLSIHPSLYPSINTKAQQYTTPTPCDLQFSFFPLLLSASPGASRALFDGDMKHLLGERSWAGKRE